MEGGLNEIESVRMLEGEVAATTTLLSMPELEFVGVGAANEVEDGMENGMEDASKGYV